MKFNELITMEIARARRFVHPLSLIYLDIDHFKKINDTYGHAVGDEVLKAVADIVKASIRTTNYIARWGGEEFIILAYETDIEGAANLAERIRGAIETRSFDTAGSVTVSMGVTLFKDTDTEAAFIKRGDDALYRAKENGRNRIEIND